MSAPNYQASDFATAIQNLMPRGRAWPRDLSALMAKVRVGLGPTWAAHTLQNNNLLIDAFPATAVQLLPEWEAALGLPDPCAGPAPTLRARQAQVVARFTGVGGQSISSFVSYAAKLGFPITVKEFTPFCVGQQAMGSPLGLQEWAFTWRATGQTPSVSNFLAGHSTAGEPLGAWGNRVLQCELNVLKPAHTYLNVAYTT
jgi:uncharacterized protein YmfQ (DUF2313 family)